MTDRLVCPDGHPLPDELAEDVAGQPVCPVCGRELESAEATGRSLWDVMPQQAQPEPSDEAVESGGEPTGDEVHDGTNARGLWEVIEGEKSTPALPVEAPVELGALQVAGAESPPMLESIEEKTAGETAAVSEPGQVDHEVRLSNNSVWSLAAGAASLPLSALAPVSPTLWLRLPALACGLGAGYLGFLAIGEIRKAAGRGKGQGLALAGIALGILGMFLGPVW